MTSIESSGSQEQPGPSRHPYVQGMSGMDHAQSAGAGIGGGFGEITVPGDGLQETPQEVPDESAPTRATTPSERTRAVPPHPNYASIVHEHFADATFENEKIVHYFEDDRAIVKASANVRMPTRIYDALQHETYWQSDQPPQPMDVETPTPAVDIEKATARRIGRITANFIERGGTSYALQPGESTENLDLRHAVLKVIRDSRIEVFDDADDQPRSVMDFETRAAIMEAAGVYDGDAAVLRVDGPDGTHDIHRRVSYYQLAPSGTQLSGVDANEMDHYFNLRQQLSPHVTIGEVTAYVDDEGTIVERITAAEVLQPAPLQGDLGPGTPLLRRIGHALFASDQFIPEGVTLDDK